LWEDNDIFRVLTTRQICYVTTTSLLSVTHTLSDFQLGKLKRGKWNKKALLSIEVLTTN